MLPVLLGQAAGLAHLLALVERSQLAPRRENTSSSATPPHPVVSADSAISAALSRLSGLSEALGVAAVATEVLCRDLAPDLAAHIATQRREIQRPEQEGGVIAPPETPTPIPTTPTAPTPSAPLAACLELVRSACGELSLLVDEGRRQEQCLEEHAELIVGFGDKKKAGLGAGRILVRELRDER